MPTHSAWHLIAAPSMSVFFLHLPNHIISGAHGISLSGKSPPEDSFRAFFELVPARFAPQLLPAHQATLA